MHPLRVVLKDGESTLVLMPAPAAPAATPAKVPAPVGLRWRRRIHERAEEPRLPQNAVEAIGLKSLVEGWVECRTRHHRGQGRPRLGGVPHGRRTRPRPDPRGSNLQSVRSKSRQSSVVAMCAPPECVAYTLWESRSKITKEPITCG